MPVAVELLVIRGGAGSTVRSSVAVAVPPALEAVSVTELVPVVEAVPEMIPVTESIASPAGKPEAP